MKHRFPLVSLLLVFLLSACGRWEVGLPEHILARVNGEEITVEEVTREFNDLLSELGKGRMETDLRDLKEAYLHQVIERKILVQEARRAGIKVSPEELNQAILEVKSDYPGEGFGEKLGLKGMTLEEWKLRIEEKLLAEKMMRTVFAFRGEIDKQEAFRYYEDHRASFQIKPRVKARQIVVSDGEEAIQILKRLKKGEPFEKLAAKKSLGPERIQGGDLGYFSEGERPIEFDSVFSMEVGSVSEVIKSPYGYHIFKVEDKIESREIPFEEAKSRILKELEGKKAEEQYQQWLEGLKARAKIKTNKKWLRS
jgi:peptidyl-prolyl cis-trans isomerase C